MTPDFPLTSFRNRKRSSPKCNSAFRFLREHLSGRMACKLRNCIHWFVIFFASQMVQSGSNWFIIRRTSIGDTSYWH
jgi:hypothetical protein